MRAGVRISATGDAIGSGRTSSESSSTQECTTTPAPAVGSTTVGLLGAAAAARVIENVLFGIPPTDPMTFGAVTTVLLAVGLLTCWLPARRATRIDPLDTLRDA